MSFVIKIEGVKYTWDPTKSTPDWPKPADEMRQVVIRLKKYNVEKIIDFGCGRARNAGLLATNFSRVYLVEVQKNMSLVKAWMQKYNYPQCTAFEWEVFKKAKIRADACLLSCVLHTLPNSNLRKQIISTIRSKLTNRGLVAFITPAHDSKYREKHLKDSKVEGDGVVRLFSDKTFSFYKNYEWEEFLEFINEVGLRMCEKIPGDHRYIALACPKAKEVVTG